MKKLAGIDGMRAIACLMIMLHHIFQHLSSHPEWSFFSRIHWVFLGSAPAGVSVFFVLSGLLLSLPFWESYLDNKTMPSLLHYAWRRSARIIPGFYLVLIASFVVQSIFVPDTQYAWRRLVAGLTSINGFHYTTLFPVGTNGPLWSISFEVFSYLLLPLFMLGLFRWGGVKKISTGILYWGIAMLFIFLLNYLVHVFFQTENFEKGWEYVPFGGAKLWMPNYNPVGFFAHFSMGIFASGFIVFMRRNEVGRSFFKRHFIFDLLSIVGFLSCALIMWDQRNNGNNLQIQLNLQSQPFFYPYFAASIALVVANAPFTHWARLVLDNKFFIFTAKISYGLYLWHFLLMYIVSRYVPEYYQSKFLTENNSAEDMYRWAILSATVVASAYIIASASWFLFEKPILNYRRSTKSRSGSQVGIPG